LAERLAAPHARHSPPLPPSLNPPHPQLTGLKAKRDAVTSELDALRAKESEARGDVPALIAERKEASEVITALRKKQGEVRDAFNARWQEFKKQERAWRVWAAHERKARNEERKKEYDERQAARQAAEKASKPNKYEQQVRGVWGAARRAGPGSRAYAPEAALSGRLRGRSLACGTPVRVLSSKPLPGPSPPTPPGL
jgi:hypothetical protein